MTPTLTRWQIARAGRAARREALRAAGQLPQHAYQAGTPSRISRAWYAGRLDGDRHRAIWERRAAQSKATS